MVLSQLSMNYKKSTMCSFVREECKSSSKGSHGRLFRFRRLLFSLARMGARLQGGVAEGFFIRQKKFFRVPILYNIYCDIFLVLGIVHYSFSNYYYILKNFREMSNSTVTLTPSSGQVVLETSMVNPLQLFFETPLYLINLFFI